MGRDRPKAKKKVAGSSSSIVDLVADKFYNMKQKKDKEQQAYMEMKNRELNIREAEAREIAQLKREKLKIQRRTLKLAEREKHDRDILFYNSIIDMNLPLIQQQKLFEMKMEIKERYNLDYYVILNVGIIQFVFIMAVFIFTILLLEFYLTNMTVFYVLLHEPVSVAHQVQWIHIANIIVGPKLIGYHLTPDISICIKLPQLDRVGKATSIHSLLDLQSLFWSFDVTDCTVKHLDGLRLASTLTSDLKTEDRITWLRIEGLPIHVWCSEAFSHIASVWGTVLIPDECETNDPNFVYGKVCILTREIHHLNKVIDIKVDGLVTKIRVSESIEDLDSLFGFKKPHMVIKDDLNFDDSVPSWVDDDANDMVGEIKPVVVAFFLVQSCKRPSDSRMKTAVIWNLSIRKSVNIVVPNVLP
ncbi:hypothetical protein Tco_1483428 [Tanacetum coccineum]